MASYQMHLHLHICNTHRGKSRGGHKGEGIRWDNQCFFASTINLVPKFKALLIYFYNHHPLSLNTLFVPVTLDHYHVELF